MARLDLLPRIDARRTPNGFALRNVVLACCRLSLTAAAGRGDPASVHRARQALKRSRAVIRLAEGLGLPDAQAARQSLAHCGRALSVGRDEAVILDLSRKLSPPPQKGARRPPPIRTENVPHFPPQFRRDLIAARSRARSLEWKSCQADQLEHALHRSWKRLRRRTRGMPRHWDREAVHEWRKSAITLREQLWVLEPVLDPKFNAFRKQLHKLSRHLGRALDAELLLSKPVSIPTSPAHRELRRAARQLRSQEFQGARKSWPRIKTAWSKLPKVGN